MIEVTLSGQQHGFPDPLRAAYPWPMSNSVSEPAIPSPNASAGAAARATSRDRAAERALYEQHVDRIFRLALRMTGNAELAEDLTQDIFLRAFDRLHQFRGDAGLGTWLHRVAVSVILNAIKKRKTTAGREVPLDVTAPAASNSGAIELDVRDRVRAAVAQLPEELRVVVLLYDVEGYQHNEIADLLGISAGACRMRLLRAHQMLRTMLPIEREEWK
jgi:RNA polymerase sigma-70 factor (ECF subfamily)